MAEVAPGRSTRAGCRFSAPFVVIALALAAVAGVSTAAAQSGPTEVDVRSFSVRAAAWSQANVAHQAAATERAIELGEEAAAAEAEAERLAAAAATTTTTTTTAAPTTTTTAAPTTTTAAPTTTTAAPAEADDGSGEGDESTDTTTTTTEAPAGGPTPEQWEALRQCESGGRYDALSPGGRYRGAYQFSQATWDWVAGWANPALVGVDPAAASVADQDAQAQALYDRQGSGPWPTCGRYLP